MPELNYVEFYKLVKNKTDRKDRIIYQFYFLRDNLTFITQGIRNRKHFNEYYLNQGKIFFTEGDNTLPILSEDQIDVIKNSLLAIRNNQ